MRMPSPEGPSTPKVCPGRRANAARPFFFFPFSPPPPLLLFACTGARHGRKCKNSLVPNIVGDGRFFAANHAAQSRKTFFFPFFLFFPLFFFTLVVGSHKGRKHLGGNGGFKEAAGQFLHSTAFPLFFFFFSSFSLLPLYSPAPRGRDKGLSNGQAV